MDCAVVLKRIKNAQQIGCLSYFLQEKEGMEAEAHAAHCGCADCREALRCIHGEPETQEEKPSAPSLRTRPPPPA